jgi:hypothetical protein
MRWLTKLPYVLSACLLIKILFPLILFAEESPLARLQYDAQGDARYSRYNFTDQKKTYNGFDAWTELKVSYWVDEKQSFSPLLSVIPAYTSDNKFWWQRNVQVGTGLQWYPFETFLPQQRPQTDQELKGELDQATDKYRHLRGIRLFAIYARRFYYDRPENVETEKTDLQIGMDYYYDNLFDDLGLFGVKPLTIVAWTNAGYRKTNFSLDDYNAFLWTGNLKLGPKYKYGNSLFLPYALADWTYVPQYDERWWENFFRVGGGVRWYPKTNVGGEFWKDLLKRFHIFGEVLHNVQWLGDPPPDGRVEETDYRVGLGFATGGIFRGSE